MKKSVHTFLCLFILSIGVTAQQQAPFLQWQKALGGSGDDRANSIQQTSDGGYIIAGYTVSNDGNVTGNHGSADYWIVKLDAVGNIQWQKTYGGTGDDEANSIHQTTDSGYIIAGISNSNDGDITGNHGDFDYWIVKLDVVGNIQWQKTYGGTDYDYASSIQQTIDGGYIVAGYANSINGDITRHRGGNNGYPDYWIVKLDVGGNIQWQKSLGGKSSDLANSIQQTTDSGYIVAGYSYSNDGDITRNHGNFDYWIVKLDAVGNIQWQKTYGGTGDDEANSIQQTTDGGYVVAGISSSNDGDVTGNHGGHAGYWVVKLDVAGNIQWQKIYGGTGYDYASSIQQTSDGGYIVEGSSYSEDGDVIFNRGLNDYWIIKLDDTGNLQWQKTYGGSRYDFASSIQQTIDGGYITAGYSSSKDKNITGNHGGNDYWVVKLSPENLNDNIRINPYHTAVNCSSTNSILCVLTNSTATYTVRLYRFGVIYDSALNVTGQVGFHNLPVGSYYATATNGNGATSYSQETGIVPPPYNINTTNITSTAAELNWTGFNCADNYAIQFREENSSEWRDKRTTDNVNKFILNNLNPSTTYVWRLASEKRVNGIKATGKFSDSIMFTTASAFTSISTNKSNNLTAKSITLFTALPNPAKNSFKILFNSSANNKVIAILYDVNSKAIWNSGLIEAKKLNGKQVNASQFAKGIFYLKITNEQGQLIGSTKIVIAN